MIPIMVDLGIKTCDFFLVAAISLFHPPTISEAGKKEGSDDKAGEERFNSSIS